jgi:hypothetical protein
MTTALSLTQTERRLECAARLNALRCAVAAFDQLAEGPTLDFPVVNRFTPGLYSRELRVPAGIKIVTQCHKVEHQFVVSKGKLMVWDPTTGDKPQIITAPFSGITKPGTVRLALILSDTVWTNFYPTDKTDVAQIEEEIAIDPHKALAEEEQKWLSLESPQQ